MKMFRRIRQPSLLVIASLVSVGVALSSIGLIAAVAGHARQESEHRDELDRELNEVAVLRSLENAVLDEVSARAAYVLTGHARYRSEFDRSQVDAKQALFALRELAFDDGEPDEVAQIERLTGQHEALSGTIERELEPLDPNAPVIFAAPSEAPFQEQYQRLRFTMAATSQAQRTQISEFNQGVQAAVQRRTRALFGIIGIWAVALVGGAAVTYLQVVRPVARISRVARKFAGGSSEERVKPAGPSELAQLARDVNFMLDTTSERSSALEIEVSERRKIASALQRTIEAERDLRDQLQHQAFHDGLTGLANRARFVDRLEHALLRRTRTAELAVVFMDLDDFKSVNDGLGHAAGDDLLRQVGGRISSCLRPADTLARLGGDEFAVLIEDGSKDEVSRICQRILSALQAPFRIEERSLFSRASLGVVFAGSDHDDPLDLLRQADVAMYVAKTGGKARAAEYRPEMEASLLEEVELENDMQRALQKQEFLLEYQPIIDVEDGTLSGFEALVRWRHPRRGIIQPASFISIAERTGLIIPLGEWVLGTACTALKRWHEMYPANPSLTMAVNVSGHQLQQADLAATVRRVIAETGIAPETLVLEITETTMLADTSQSVEHLKELHQLGLRLAVDDFGTGYSSLAYLRKFPLDILKVDKTFMDHVVESGREKQVVRSIIDLGRALHLSVVAEGIEREPQLGLLKELSCDKAQGFLFSRPMSDFGIEQLLSERRDTGGQAA